MLGAGAVFEFREAVRCAVLDNVLYDVGFACALVSRRELKHHGEVGIFDVLIRPRKRGFAWIRKLPIEPVILRCFVAVVDAHENVLMKTAGRSIVCRTVDVDKLNESARLGSPRNAGPVAAVAGPIALAAGTRPVAGQAGFPAPRAACAESRAVFRFRRDGDVRNAGAVMAGVRD